jgi:hypothetical protein
MSTTHGAVKTRCHEDTTDDVYLVGAGCVVCAQDAYGSRFRVQGLESGNVDPMRATLGN